MCDFDLNVFVVGMQRVEYVEVSRHWIYIEFPGKQGAATCLTE